MANFASLKCQYSAMCINNRNELQRCCHTALGRQLINIEKVAWATECLIAVVWEIKQCGSREWEKRDNPDSHWQQTALMIIWHLPILIVLIFLWNMKELFQSCYFSLNKYAWSMQFAIMHQLRHTTCNQSMHCNMGSTCEQCNAIAINLFNKK